MSDDLKDILSNNNKDIDNRQLMDYLNDQLSEANKHAIEKNMANDDFTNDAIEGLQEFDSTKHIASFVAQLDKDLQKKITKSKNRRNKRKWKDQPYTYIAIAIILLLLIISYIVIKNYTIIK
ncbi:MAG TPA: hypothetical protein VK705_01210 [Ferruginibacter sp.]|nr:hypothetical protein [Ferruginibacter sp.]